MNGFIGIGEIILFWLLKNVIWYFGWESWIVCKFLKIRKSIW